MNDINVLVYDKSETENITQKEINDIICKISFD